MFGKTKLQSDYIQTNLSTHSSGLAIDLNYYAKLNERMKALGTIFMEAVPPTKPPEATVPMDRRPKRVKQVEPAYVKLTKKKRR